MTTESDMWGWKHVTIYGGFDKGSGTKRWKCNHCHLRYNGSYSRVRAHLLGFAGVGIKGCAALDKSLQEAFHVLEEQRLARKKRKSSSGNPICNRSKTSQINLPGPSRTISKEDVDDIVARFLYAEGLNLNIVNSPYFKEMAKGLASFGLGYEPPSVEKLSDSYLNKEKGRIERSLALVKESWPHTGCTILCVNRLDSSTSCFCINFFVSSPRGVMFLKAMDINEGDEADNMFITILSDIIVEAGPRNVVQVITHLGQASIAFESVIISKFPHIFWSHCASHSMFMLIEAITEVDWMKSVLFYAKAFEQLILTFQISNMKEYSNPLALKFPPCGTVHKIYEMKEELQALVVSDEWKQWKVNLPEDSISYEANILAEEFWERVHLMLQLLSKPNIEKSTIGDVYDWRVRSLESLRSKGVDAIALAQVEMLTEARWDALFSPLHAAGYILNPKYFGKGQSNNKNVMRSWKATLDRYESDSEARRTLREQLSSYLRLEGSLGEEDAVECRDKMDPVAWWENFGFETPELQRLAIRVLSQVSSVSFCDDCWMCKNLPCKETVMNVGVKRVEDLVFVQNNLRLQSRRSVNGSSCCDLGNTA